MKVEGEQYAVIGDVVDSRSRADRRRLHRQIVAALDACNEGIEALDPLAVTVGDEFQGVYATLGNAIAATLRLRLDLLDAADTRFGIGRGTILPLDAERRVQDGPAWWAAREAVEYVEDLASRAATREARTAYRAGPADTDVDRSVEMAVNAALICRDHLVGSMSDRSRRLLGGLMRGTPQRELAETEQISPSAVSQRVRADGLGMLLTSEAMLAGLS